MESDFGSKRKRDARTHQERLLDIRQAFKECKERAKRLNKVNECSITKIAEKACVAKSYLTGNKPFAEKGVAEDYRKIGMEIIAFREEFQDCKAVVHENSEIADLEQELDRVKSSVRPIIMELETAKSVSSNWLRELDEARKTILLLQAKLSDPVSTKGQGSGQVVGIDRAIRTVICPDKYLFGNGIYRFSDEGARHDAWLKCYDELDEALSRAHPKRLYVLVGLPCSGKSTWAANAQLYTDRHSVIFDATNLTRYERENLVQYAKRAKDVTKCCVFFDTPNEIVKERNANRHSSGKMLSYEDLDLMYKKLTLPDPYKETWIDEMIVVRNKHASS